MCSPPAVSRVVTQMSRTRYQSLGCARHTTENRLTGIFASSKNASSNYGTLYVMLLLATVSNSQVPKFFMFLLIFAVLCFALPDARLLFCASETDLESTQMPSYIFLLVFYFYFYFFIFFFTGINISKLGEGGGGEVSAVCLLSRGMYLCILTGQGQRYCFYQH